MYCIYVFLDEKNIPYYVGKSSNFEKRKRDHLTILRNNLNLCNKYPKYRKTKKLIKNGFKFNMVSIKKNLNEKDANKYERKLIKSYKDKGIKLTNLTNGGEGITEIGRILLKQKSKERKRKPHSEETKKKMSEIRMGMEFSKEHKKNLSIAWRKRKPCSKKTKNKLSNSLKGSVNIKKYVLTDPKGKDHITTNGLTLFCEQNGLQPANMIRSLKGKYKNKGWVIKKCL